MYLRILILLFLGFGTLARIVKDDSPALEWPKKYAIEASKMSLTAGWVEDIKAWRTSSQSRVDYNNGAVKSFAFAGKKRLRKPNFGVKYQIHPETTEEEENVMRCQKIKGTIKHIITLDTILPKSLGEYEFSGYDTVREGNVSKYFYNEVDESTDTRKTLMVKYDEENKIWIPVRFEEIEYNLLLGNLQKHDVWEFHNFKTEFSKDVFSTDKYDCKGVDEDKYSENMLFVDPENEKHIDRHFEAFKQKHGKVYADDKEHIMRRNIFKNNMRLITATNRRNLGYKLAINKFADLTPAEMKRHKGLIRRSKDEVGTVAFPYSETQIRDMADSLPTNFDSRTYGYVTPVDDQEDCGSCWTFGTTSAVEGALARSNGGRLVRLSNQALIDCAWGFGAAGCDGGSDSAAYRWIMKHGMPTEEEYGTYANKDGFCRIDNMTETYKIRGFTDVTPFSIEALKVAVVKHGPLSVSIQSPHSLAFYSGGIFYEPTCDPTALDHEVTLVGYGEKDGESYWIVKNSWGTNWGIDGYFHISTRDNNCGIATEPTYPVF